MTSTNPAQPIRLTVDVYLAPITLSTGSLGPISGPLFATAAATSGEVEQSPDMDGSRSRRGLLRAVYELAQTQEISLTFRDIPPVVLAGHLLGSDAALAVTGGTVDDEAVTFGQIGGWVKLAQRYLKESTVTVGSLKRGVGFTGLDADGDPADFEVNARLGMVRLLAGGAGSASTEYTVGYTYQTLTGTRVSAGQKNSFPVRLWLDAVNDGTGKDVVVEGLQVHLVPDGEVNWLSTDPVAVTLKGPVVTPAGSSAPLLFDLILSATDPAAP